MVVQRPQFLRQQQLHLVQGPVVGGPKAPGAGGRHRCGPARRGRPRGQRPRLLPAVGREEAVPRAGGPVPAAEPLPGKKRIYPKTET